MRFALPHMLWLLPVIPALVLVFLWWSARKRQALLTRFIQARLLPELTVGISLTRQRNHAILLAAASGLLVLALARPQWGFSWEEAHQRGLDIIVAIDTSKSMLADDIKPSRLERAKLAALDLMQEAKVDRLGLIAFAGGAFLQCPLTLDDGAFRQCVDELNVNIIPLGGTALGEAITTAVEAFKDDENFKVLVLFTDGEDHDPDAIKAAQRASEAGMRIFTVGLGTAEGELLRIRDENGHVDYVRDSQGQVVKSRLNESLLQEIAGAAQGFYLPLRGADTVETLYEKGLAPLPKTESKARLFQLYHERYHWPLALAILLILADILWPERRRESVVTIRPGSHPVQSIAAAITLAVLLLPTTADASAGSAMKDYQSGNYAEALSEFDHLRQQHTNDARLDFNAGAAAYRAGKFEDAVERFDKAVGAPDLQLQQRAYYNRGNAHFRAGQAQPKPDKMQEFWQQAVKDYESALKLAPTDQAAKFNLEFVKKKLEELKQKQQQQQKDKDNKDQDKKSQDKRDQQKQQSQQNQSKDNQNNKQDQQQAKDQEKQKSDQQNQQASKNQEQQDQQKENREQGSQTQNQKQPDENSEQQKQQEEAQGKNDEQEQPKEEKQGQPVQAGAMSPEQARRLLDSMKGDEKMLPVQLQTPQNRQSPAKDW